MPGRFITLEGGEGAGKSTQAARLAAALAATGLDVVRTREPGGAAGAEAIRGVLLGQGSWDPKVETLLHVAARRQHWVATIAPALAAGRWVISDRFADSTVAYQLYGQGVDRDFYDAISRAALPGVVPDLTLVLDLPVAAGLARAAARGEGNRYDRLGAAFHDRVRAGFRAIAAAEPERCVVVDAAADADTVAASLRQVVQARLGV